MHRCIAAHVALHVRFTERLLREECGQDLIEYALILGLVALGAIVSMKSATAGVVKVFTAVGTTLTGAF